MRFKLVKQGEASAQKLLPLLAMVNAGDRPADDHAEERLDIAELLIVRPDVTFFVRVEGEVADDASIRPGDILVVDRSLAPRRGDRVIVIEDGELAIKVLHASPKILRLVPHTSPKHTSEPSLEIRGIVLWVIHKAR